jgi:hypothetical protein
MERNERAEQRRSLGSRFSLQEAFAVLQVPWRPAASPRQTVVGPFIEHRVGGSEGGRRRSGNRIVSELGG